MNCVALRSKFLSVFIGFTLLVAGCARFAHQTSESEPHGIVQFVRPLDCYPEQPSVKTFDGLPVSAGPEYRVRPGPHELVTKQIDIAVEYLVGKSETISDYPTLEVVEERNLGGMPANGAFIDTMVRRRTLPETREARRHIRYVTNLLSVEAGWFFVIDGENIRKTRMQD